MVESLPRMVASLPPVQVEVGKHLVSIRLTSCTLGRPVVPGTSKVVFPSECRARASTYEAPMNITSVGLCGDFSSGVITHCSVEVSSSGMAGPVTVPSAFKMPVMLKSTNCNLRGMPPGELIRHHEEPEVVYVL